MEGFDKLLDKALKMKEAGLTDREIEDELHLSADTVQWMLAGKTKAAKKPPSDVYIGWRSIGVRSARVHKLCEIIGDIIEEEKAKKGFEYDTVVGIGMNGVPLAQATATILDKDIIIYTPGHDRKGGKVSSNFAGLTGKSAVIIDDVVSTGKTIEAAIEKLEEHGSKAVLAVVIVNKTKRDEIKGVPLRALVRTLIV